MKQINLIYYSVFFLSYAVPEKAPSTIKHGEMRRKCVYLQSS